MKPWHYYVSPQNVEIFAYDDEVELRQKMISDINNDLMTKDARAKALDEVNGKARRIIFEKNTEYRHRLANLEKEFWQDCRRDLSYPDFLNEEGVQIIESQAWEQGHSSGFSEVFGCLVDLVDFAKRISVCYRNYNA